MTSVASVLVCSIVVTFLACGKPPKLCDPDALLQKPQLCVDRDTLGFAQEFNSGTFIGATGFEALSIRNGGIEDLKISAATTSGDSQFTYRASWDDNFDDATIPETTVTGNKSVFIEVRFSPNAAKQFKGSLALTSNAENAPMKTFEVSGCGIPSDGGTSPCYCLAAGKECTVATANQCCSGTCDLGMNGAASTCH